MLGERFDSLRRALRIPGLAVVVLHDTTIVLARGYGFADVERRIPVTPETPFNTASVAKTISAVVALRLVQDGLLDLDRPMRRYTDFAEFCDAARAQGGIFFGDYACTDDQLTLRHVLSMTANGEQPGTRFWYNPPSYSWASRPMAQVAGRTFSELVDSLVFRPASMRNSARTNRRLPLPRRIADALATPYHIDSAGRVIKSDPPPPQGDGAAGGVIASAMDLARFDIALANGRLLTPASRVALWSPSQTPSGQSLPYGLGWFLGTHESRRVAWHTGLWEGRYSALYLKVLSDTPAERLTLILLANSDGLQWPTRFDEAAIERSPFAAALLARSPLAHPGEVAPTPIVLSHATIVDVNAAKPNLALRKDQTVLIIGDRIAAVGKGIRIPTGAIIVDVSGKFLIPGLWDMHVHITDPSYFAMFIANGVTGVRDMGGGAADANDGCESIVADSLIAWRNQVRTGNWIGPRIFLSGPAASGTGSTSSLPVRTPGEARRAVDSLRALRVDFVKVYEKVPLDAYRTLLHEARNVGLPVAGHVPIDGITLVQAAELGQRSIEHVRDHLLTCFTSDPNELLRFFRADNWSASDIEWGLSRHGECGAAVSAFRKNSTWLVPTLTVERSKVAVEDPRFMQDPARALLPRSIQTGFDTYAKGKLGQLPSDRASEHLWWKTQKRVVGELHRKGVGILAGTDAACQGGIPGHSLHQELQLLVESGLTPLEALQTATVNPAKYQGLSNEVGAILPGYLADLVLLDRNPLDNIGNTRKIHAVLTGGRLLSRNDLDALRENISRPR